MRIDSQGRPTWAGREREAQARRCLQAAHASRGMGRSPWRAMPRPKGRENKRKKKKKESCVFGYEELPYGVGLYGRVNCEFGHLDEICLLGR